jgi:hypothetical protein
MSRQKTVLCERGELRLTETAGVMGGGNKAKQWAKAGDSQARAHRDLRSGLRASGCGKRTYATWEGCRKHEPGRRSSQH